MKKWVTVTLVGLLSLVLFLALAQAQQAQPPTAAKPNAQQKAASLENTLTCFETFMNGVLTKIQANMNAINTFNGKVSNLRDIVQAVSIEIKQAEGKMIGLRQDLGTLGSTQKKYGDRIAALETKLAALKQACDEVSKKADVNQNDIASLQQALAALNKSFTAFAADYKTFKQSVQAEFSAVNKNIADLQGRVKKLEDQDVGTFKRKVLELERTVSALSIKIDNNRTKLEGFDQAISGFGAGIAANKKAILANKTLLENHEARIATLEKNNAKIKDVQDQLNSLYLISIVGLLAGVGALVWGFIKK